MKIAIAVHGRFHAFDLARELSKRHDVTVFTNYPKWSVERFGINRSRVRSFWLHGVVARAATWLARYAHVPFPEVFLHEFFGKWVAAQVVKEEWDVVHCFSGVSEETLRAMKGRPGIEMIVRGSAHIRLQASLLEEEERRTGTKLDRPSAWMINREEREYRLAQRIVVLSTFARNSFLDEGFDPSKIYLLPLGVQVDAFAPSPGVLGARMERILSGQPLRVLFVGALSFRKGMWDMAALIGGLDQRKFQFRFVGPVNPESKSLIRKLGPSAEFVPKQPHAELPKWYAWGDLFVFPTIEDGFAVVLAQARASGLPILATTNCCGPDLIREGHSGWVLPIRNPEAFSDRLRWCDTHRIELADMVRELGRAFENRSWTDVAYDFEALCMSVVNGN